MTATIGRTERKQSLRGISLFENKAPVKDWRGLNHGVSFAGGSDMVIAGYGFQEEPRANQIKMKVKGLTDEELTFTAP